MTFGNTLEALQDLFKEIDETTPHGIDSIQNVRAEIRTLKCQMKAIIEALILEAGGHI